MAEEGEFDIEITVGKSAVTALGDLHRMLLNDGFEDIVKKTKTLSLTVKSQDDVDVVKSFCKLFQYSGKGRKSAVKKGNVFSVITTTGKAEPVVIKVSPKETKNVRKILKRKMIGSIKTDEKESGLVILTLAPGIVPTPDEVGELEEKINGIEIIKP